MNTPLNPDALVDAVRAYQVARTEMHTNGSYDRARHLLSRSISAYLAVAQPVVNSVEAFINERPGYITALKNTRGTDDQSDYWRWQGHSESRRQLAQKLGWTVPHEPGETTRPEVKP